MPGPIVVSIAGWALPGLGYFLIGEKARAITACLTILALFIFGLLIAGVRVIDVPGYNGVGQKKMAGASWSLTQQPLPTLMDKPWFIPQLLTGPVTIVSGYASLSVAETYQKPRAILADVGTLYTAVAGMLNLLVIIDSAHRAARWHNDHPRIGPM